MTSGLKKSIGAFLALKGTFASIALSTSFMVALPSSSFARYCSNCPGLHRDTRKIINDRITEAEKALIEALRQQTGEQGAVLDRQVEAQRRITDAQLQNDAIRLRQEFRAEAETSGQFDPDPMACILLDMLKGSESGSSSSGMTGKQVREAARFWLDGEHPSVREGSTTMHRTLLDAQEQFKGVGGVNDPTTDWAVVYDSNSINMDETGAALEYLLINTIDPTPPRPMSDADMNTPAGMAREAERNAIRARNSAALEATSFALQLRKAEASPDALEYYIERSRYNRPTDNGISELQALDIMTTFHYAPNADELETRESLTEKNWLERLHNVASLQARMDYLQLEQDNRMLNALGVIASNLTPQDGNIGARP